MVVEEEENILDYERKIKQEKVKSWKQGALCGEFFQETSDVAPEESWRWRRNVFFRWIKTVSSTFQDLDFDVPL